MPVADALERRVWLKSLLVTNDFPPVISGISTYFYNLWKYLPAESNLILTTKCNDNEHEFVDRGLNVRRSLRFPSGWISKAVNFMEQIVFTSLFVKKEKIDTLHCGQLLGSGTVGFIMHRLFGIDYLIYVYGHETTSVYCNSRFSSSLIRKIVWNARGIVAVSHYVAKEFIAYGVPEEKVRVVLPGVDTSQFRSDRKSNRLRERLCLNGHKVLLTVARLTERKGQDVVIRAMPEILSQVGDVVYLIVGKGHYEAQLRELVEDYGLSSKVIFSGHVSDAELPKYYELADLYVMPNREHADSTDSIEGFGISFLEANACETPVIGGDSGGVPDAIVHGETGILVDPNRPESVADAIIGLLRQPDRLRDMGRMGRERVEREFAWKVVANKFQIRKRHSLFQI